MPIRSAELDERVFKQVKLGVRHFYSMWVCLGAMPKDVEASLQRLQQAGRVLFNAATGGWAPVRTSAEATRAVASAPKTGPMVRVEGTKLSFALDDEVGTKPKRKRR